MIDDNDKVRESSLKGQNIKIKFKIKLVLNNLFF